MKPAVGHVKWLVAALAIRRSHCQRYARPLHVTTKTWSDRELRPHHAKLAMTTTTPSVLMPAGAIKVYDWDDTESPHPIRVFDGTTRFIECNGRYEKEDVMVRLQGIQHADGRVERQIAVSPLHEDHPLTIEQARQFARALIAAADEIDQMSEYDKLTVSP
jgi:hypothetical protein